jgi:hypothetical protein
MSIKYFYIVISSFFLISCTTQNVRNISLLQAGMQINGVGVI